MHRRVPPKGLSPLEKKVPKSEKYSHVRGVLDTGLTVNKVKSVTSREFAKRRDEIFFRITRTQLYELFTEYEADEFESINENMNDSKDIRIVTYSENDQPTYEKPYLILDAREPGEYNLCHILQARSLPYTMLRRDQYHPDIYRFRNKPETLIIIYCDDERISREAAKLLVDRGIDNIFLLTVGMKEFAYDFPAFVEGEVPSPPKSRMQNTTTSRLTKIPENDLYAPSSPPHKLTTSKLERHNNLYSHSGGSTSRSRDGRSESNMTSKSVAESVISRATSRKGKF